ncbi:hypothetical protein SAMN04487928_14917, partial [Butyrivibrio proteoclasticus]
MKSGGNCDYHFYISYPKTNGDYQDVTGSLLLLLKL